MNAAVDTGMDGHDTDIPVLDQKGEYNRLAKLKSFTPNDTDKALCQKIDDHLFRSTPQNRYLVHTVVNPGSNRVDPLDVTLVTQLSLERLNMLMLLLKHWQGPISVVVYCSREEAVSFLQTKFWENYDQISIHVVYKQSNQSYYPINYLRNVAFTNSLTEYAFLCDVDFMPSKGLHNYLVKAVNTFLKDPNVKCVLVVAAFEQKAAIYSFPESKHQLQILYNNRTVSRFHENIDSHLQTNYSVFFEQSFPYRVNWKYGYEPFMVVRSSILKYDESFTGYGFNKIVHTAELHAMKYEFIVVAQEFMLHLTHPVSKESASFRQRSILYRCMKFKEAEYRWSYLPLKYGDKWDKENQRQPFIYHDFT